MVARGVSRNFSRGFEIFLYGRENLGGFF